MFYVISFNDGVIKFYQGDYSSALDYAESYSCEFTLEEFDSEEDFLDFI